MPELKWVTLAACGGAIIVLGVGVYSRRRRKTGCNVFISEDQALDRVFHKCSAEPSTGIQPSCTPSIPTDRRMDLNGFKEAFDLLGVSISDDTLELLFNSFSVPDSAGAINSAAGVVPAMVPRYLNKESFLLAAVQVPSAFREKENWIKSLELHKLVSNHLPTSQTSDPISAIRLLGRTRLRRICARISADLADLLFREAAIKAPAQMILNGAPASNSKFAMTCCVIQARYGILDDFFQGLDGRIGLPNPNVLKAMEDEHCDSDDAEDKFTTSNYGGTETCPKLEWEFVTCPVAAKVYPGKGRDAIRLENFLNHETTNKAKLIHVEVLGLRLFTGPMFMKYNASLREFPREMYESLKGNRYTTTIHAIVSGIIKLSTVWELPKTRKVYRGMSGVVLPPAFWKKDAFGCRGGVEYGLMSTTTDREVAVQYTLSKDGKPQMSTIFEIEVGQVDRGASLSWVSQYPAEKEILMPPLSNLEVIGEPTMDGESMVMRLRINVNIKSLTISQLEGRRKQLHLAMMGNLVAEAKRDLVSIGYTRIECDQLLSDFTDKIKEVEAKEPTWLNIDKHFREAVNDALNYKTWTLHKGTVLRELSGKSISILNQVEKMHVQEFANYSKRGFMYALRSGLSEFPFNKVVKGSVSEVELPLSTTKEQASIVWECLKDSVSSVHTMILKDSHGKTARLPVRSIICGHFLDLAPVVDLGSQAAALLIQAARHNTRLNHLSLASANLDDSFADVVVEVLSSCPHVLSVGPLDVYRFHSEATTTLNLDHAGLTRVEMRIFIRLLASIPSLKSLSLAGNALYTPKSRLTETDECLFARLCGVLETLSQLSSLNLSATRLGASPSNNLESAGSTSRSLQNAASISFTSHRSRSQRSRIGNQCFAFVPYVVNLIRCNTTLKVLDLRRNAGGITVDVLESVANAFKDRGSSDFEISAIPAGHLGQGFVTRLDLRQSNLGPSEAGFLALFISANTSLKTIDLAQNRLASTEQLHMSYIEEQELERTAQKKVMYNDDFPGFNQLCKALSQLRLLTHLDISYNYLCGSSGYSIDGMSDLCQCITSNSSLRFLNLAGNSFSVDDTKILGSALCQNTVLLSLNNLPWKSPEYSAPLLCLESGSTHNLLRKESSTVVQSPHLSRGDSSRQMDQMKEIFDEFDADKSGMLDCDELQEFGFALGQNWSGEDCAKIMDVIDVDKSGTVSFEEFTDWYFRRGPEPENKDLQDLSSSLRAQLFLRSTLRKARSLGSTSTKPSKNKELMAARVILRWLSRVRLRRNSAWICDLSRRIKEPAYEIVFVAQRLLSCPFIVRLNLARCRLEDEHLNILWRGLTALESLKDLDLRNNNISHHCGDSLMRQFLLLRPSCETICTIPVASLQAGDLPELKLCSKDLGLLEATILSHVLPSNPMLHKISLSNNPKIFSPPLLRGLGMNSPLQSADRGTASLMNAIGLQTALTYLDISGCFLGLNAQALEQCCSDILPSLPFLTSLHIHNNSISLASCDSLFGFLLNATSLTMLNGHENPRGHSWNLRGVLREAAYELAFVLCRTHVDPNLIELELRQNTLFQQGNQLTRFIRESSRLRNLKVLGMDCEGLNIEFCQKVSDNFPDLDRFCDLPVGMLREGNVDSLMLNSLSLGPFELDMLTCMLDRHVQSALKVLDLSKNSLSGDKRLQEIGNSARLQRQVFSGRGVSPQLGAIAGPLVNKEESGFPKLCRVVNARYSTLTSLFLGDNFLGGQEMQGFSDVIAANKALTAVDFSNNHLGIMGPDAAWQALCSNIKGCHGLAHLDLSGNAISALGLKGTQALETAIKSFTALTRLNLAFNNLDGRQLSTLISALKSLTTLRYLKLGGSIKKRLWSSGIGDQRSMTWETMPLASATAPNVLDRPAAKSIEELLRANKNLIELDLRSLRSDPPTLFYLGTAIMAILRSSEKGLQLLSKIPIHDLRQRNLVELDLSWQDLGPAECIVLTNFLDGNTQLRALNLMGNRLGEIVGEDIPEGLGSFEDLCDVIRSLAVTEPDPEPPLDLAQVQRAKSVMSAQAPPTITRESSTSSGTHFAGKASCSTNGQLAFVDIRANKLPVEHAVRREDGMPLMMDEHRRVYDVLNCIPWNAIIYKKLYDLQLPDRQLDEVDGILLARALKECPNYLHRLNLSGNPKLFRSQSGENLNTAQDFAEAFPLWSAMSRCSRLQDLNLSRNHITSQQTRAFAEALLTMSMLSTLDLSYNQLAEHPNNAATGIAASQQLRTIFRDLKTLEVLFASMASGTERMRNLNLRGVAVCPLGARALARLLSACTTLDKLDLAGTQLGPSGITSLAPGIRANNSLASLDLSVLPGTASSTESLGAEGLISLIDAMRHGSIKLRHLALGGHKLNHLAAEILLPLLSNLVELDLSHNRLGFRGAGCIVSALSSEMVSLDLSYNGLLLQPTSGGLAPDLPPEFRTMCQELGRLSNLKNLALSGNDIDDSAARVLMPSLQSSSSTLRSVAFAMPLVRADMFADAAARVAFRIDGSFPSGLGPEGSSGLSSVLSGSCRLETLDLSGNNLGFAGARAVSATLLGCMESLARVDLSGCHLRDRGATALAEGLGGGGCGGGGSEGRGRRLAIVSLACNAIGDAGATALAKGLGGCLELASLRLGLDAGPGVSPSANHSASTAPASAGGRDLWRNTVSCGGATALSEALQGRSCLTSLALDQCEVGAAGAWALVRMVFLTTALMHLAFEGNPIPAAPRVRLRAAVTANEQRFRASAAPVTSMHCRQI